MSLIVFQQKIIYPGSQNPGWYRTMILLLNYGLTTESKRAHGCFRVVEAVKLRKKSKMTHRLIIEDLKNLFKYHLGIICF